MHIQVVERYFCRIFLQAFASWLKKELMWLCKYLLAKLLFPKSVGNLANFMRGCKFACNISDLHYIAIVLLLPLIFGIASPAPSLNIFESILYSIHAANL